MWIHQTTVPIDDLQKNTGRIPSTTLSLSLIIQKRLSLSLSLPPSLPPMHGEEGPHYQGVGVPSENFLFLEILEESVKVCTDYSKDPRLLYSK
jgi:hypothetical protein